MQMRRELTQLGKNVAARRQANRPHPMVAAMVNLGAVPFTR